MGEKAVKTEGSIHYIIEKSYKRDLLYEKATNSDEYGIPWVGM